jgi:hypothetical protein
MRQSIEKEQKTKPFKASVAVMFRGGKLALSGCMLFCTRKNAAPLLSAALKSISAAPSHALSRSTTLSELPRCGPLPPRRRSLSRIKKISAGRAKARSALVVLATTPHKCSPQVAATAITTMTEQRRCAAA